MRFTLRGRHALALVLSLGLAACGGDDDSTGPGDELTEAEAEIMMEALVEAGGLGLSTVTGGGPALIIAAAQEFPIGPVTEECPQGGTVKVQGNATIDDEAQTIDWGVTQTHQGCKATAPSNGTLWTFDGAPNVAIDFFMSFTETSFDMDGTQEGKIKWAQGSRSGTCTIDVTWDMSASQDFTTVTGTVTGSVCGHAVNETIDGFEG